MKRASTKVQHLAGVLFDWKAKGRPRKTPMTESALKDHKTVGLQMKYRSFHHPNAGLSSMNRRMISVSSSDSTCSIRQALFSASAGSAPMCISSRVSR